ncbi:hypothetical protein AAMO2058_001022300 [Amorphochlora amoebiformis]
MSHRQIRHITSGERFRSSAHRAERSGRETNMWWTRPPTKALVVKKFDDHVITDVADKISKWMEGEGCKVFVDCEQNSVDLESRFSVVDTDTTIDLVVCLGGDGTILHANEILNDHVRSQRLDNLPPVISFSMGSLGFLTPFSAFDWENVMESIFNANSLETATPCSMRKRLVVKMKAEERCILNDVVIGRGVSPSLSKILCHVDSQPVALFQSDGLIVSTPSGSTAYSLSAGGTMIAPSVEATLLTPIAPHSLASRPVGIHSESKIRVTIPPSARTSAFLTFDGRDPMIELPIGESIDIEQCTLDLPLLTKHKLDHEWFQSLNTKLGWNIRIRYIDILIQDIHFSYLHAISHVLNYRYLRTVSQRGGQGGSPSCDMSVMDDFTALKVFHFTLGVMACAWTRFQSIFLTAMGLSPSTIGLLSSLGFMLKTGGYLLWGFTMDRFGGSRYVLIASVILSATSLEIFRRAVASKVLLLMVIGKAIRALSNAQYCLLDALTVRIVKKHVGSNQEDYGRQRFWGSLGFGLFSMAVGFVIDASGIGTDFIFVHTYCMSALFVLLLSVPLDGDKTPSPPSVQSTQRKDGLSSPSKSGGKGVSTATLFKEVSYFFSTRALIVFFCHLLAINIVSCVFDSVIWIHMETIKAPRSLVGVASSVQTFVEFPLFFYSKKILSHFSHRQMFLIAHTTLLIRLALLSVLGNTGNTYLIIPIQFLHGFSFGANWLASVEYAQFVAPETITASVQSYISTTGILASAFGTYLWGYIYENHSTWSFVAATMVEAITLASIVLFVPSLGRAVKSRSAAVEKDIEITQLFRPQGETRDTCVSKRTHSTPSFSSSSIDLCSTTNVTSNPGLGAVIASNLSSPALGSVDELP